LEYSITTTRTRCVGEKTDKGREGEGGSCMEGEEKGSRVSVLLGGGVRV